MGVTDEFGVRRRRIAFRAWHRGMRETDLILGRFADAELERCSAADLDAFEAVLELPDQDLYRCIAEPAAAPPPEVDAAFLARIRAFHWALGATHPGVPGALPRGTDARHG